MQDDAAKIFLIVALILGVFLIIMASMAEAEDRGPYGFSEEWEYSKFLKEPERTRAIREDKARFEVERDVYDDVRVIDRIDGRPCVIINGKYAECY